MNLQDSKEPQKSGNSESREVKPKLIIYTSPNGSHLMDAIGYYNGILKMAETTPFGWVIHDECNEINETIIKNFLK